MNLVFEIDRNRLVDAATGAQVSSLQFAYPDKYPLSISVSKANQPFVFSGNVYVTLKPAASPLSAPLALLTVPVNSSSTVSGVLDTFVQEMDAWLPAANKRAAAFEILVAAPSSSTEVSVSVPAQISRRYNSVDQPGVTVAEQSLATQAEAEAGVNNAKWMSPLRVSQAISALGEQLDDTDDLSEGTTNLYFTAARAKAAVASDIAAAVSTESQTRTAADTALGQRIDLLASNLGTESLDSIAEAAASINTLQSQIDGKAPAAHPHTASQITDFTSAVVAAAPPTTDATLLTSGTLADARLSAAATASLAKADSAQPKNLAASIEVKAVSQGAYSDGTTIPAGTSVEEVLRKMLQTRVPATYAAPTLSLSANFGTQAEIGSNYSGAITPTWQQRDAGSASLSNLLVNSVQFASAAGSPPASYSIPSRLLTAAESWQLTTTYSAGPQKLDNFGDPSGAPIAAGSISSSTITITPVRRIFFGASTDTAAPASSSAIRTLASSALNPSNSSTYTLTLPAGTRRAVIAYPATLRAISSVKYVELGNTEVKDTFAESTIQVDGATSGQNATAYRVYTYISAIPLGAAATYTITI